MKLEKRALITGVNGQDGSYLAEFLLEKGYEVHGTVKPSVRLRMSGSAFASDRVDVFLGHLHECDMTDGSGLAALINRIRPTEIYNLAAQSHVGTSFASPEYTAQVNAMGCLRILESIRISGLADATRFYQASTSELFGDAVDQVQSETTAFRPRSPYAISKLFAYWITVNYREAYKMFACNGILFNHESPRRAATFVTRKITFALARMLAGENNRLRLGNLDARRDWGHARDYVEMQWRMLQHHMPSDFVISSGSNYSVREFVGECMNCVGISVKFDGHGENEVGVVTKLPPELMSSGFREGSVFLEVDPQLFRPTEVQFLLGDASRAERELGWVPKTSFTDLVREMLVADLQYVGRGDILSLKDV